VLPVFGEKVEVTRPLPILHHRFDCLGTMPKGLLKISYGPIMLPAGFRHTSSYYNKMTPGLESTLFLLRPSP
jgi:hypothetical protein